MLAFPLPSLDSSHSRESSPPTAMLSRLLSKASHLRALALVPHQSQPLWALKPSRNPSSTAARFRFFSSNGDGGDNGKESDSFFTGHADSGEWNSELAPKPWTLASEDDEKDDLFEDLTSDVDAEASEAKDEIDKAEIAKRLEREEQALTAILKGPNRAFGDLIAASGITEGMIENLIALKDLQGVDGLPPLKELEELRTEKGKKKSSAAEQERLKQEEAAKARVRHVDEKGRAYGTGRRKCSVARVWIQPGDGKFCVNDKDLDVYFPIMDYRAALLRPFSETKTLGLWDVNCTVKGGGITGQAGAILLGISRALQNWEPDLRPPLKAAGFLTRDPRMVERKKPGKAKARKSFQWVKR